MLRWTLFATVVFILGPGSYSHAQFESIDENVERGRELFLHQWEPKDELSPHGDGLGPLYNATSCVACHSQGGVGGSGANQNNAQILAVIPEPGQLSSRGAKLFLSGLRRMHPEFVDAQDRFVYGILLHRFSTTTGYDKVHQEVTTPLEETLDSEARMARMLKRRNLPPATQLPLKLVTYQKDLQFAMADRNPPQLFGLDLIDRLIQETDIAAIAELQQGSRTGITGRQGGKYGWRGQLRDLDLFVKGACAAELGLQVYEFAQVKDPLRPDYELFGSDLSTVQTSDLVAFVRSLPGPEQVLPEDPQGKSQVAQGNLLFHEIGCGACHVEKVGQLSGIYSDFLLHNMGREFEDPIPAEPVKSVEVTAGIEVMQYYGMHRQSALVRFETVEERNHYKEFKTPPLWGVADSAPYMHDGRADTLRDAIEMHGGEAGPSALRFARLSPEQQDSLMRFLQSLRAPATAEEPPRRLNDDVALSGTP